MRLVHCSLQFLSSYSVCMHTHTHFNPSATWVPAAASHFSFLCSHPPCTCPPLENGPQNQNHFSANTGTKKGLGIISHLVADWGKGAQYKLHLEASIVSPTPPVTSGCCFPLGPFLNNTLHGFSSLSSSPHLFPTVTGWSFPDNLHTFSSWATFPRNRPQDLQYILQFSWQKQQLVVFPALK